MLDSARQKWGSWSLAPAGEPPEGDPEEHLALEQRRALAAADLNGAEAAVNAVQGRVDQLNSELRAIGPQLFAIRLAAVLDDELPGIEIRRPSTPCASRPRIN